MWAEQIGLGELGLMPDQFWSLTPREFQIKFAAFVRAENRASWLVGLMALLTTRFKKSYRTPDQLLGYHHPMPRYPEKPWLSE